MLVLLFFLSPLLFDKLNLCLKNSLDQNMHAYALSLFHIIMCFCLLVHD